MFSIIPKTNLNFLVTFILSSASTLNLDQCKILSFGKQFKIQDAMKQSPRLPVKFTRSSLGLDGDVFCTADTGCWLENGLFAEGGG